MSCQRGSHGPGKTHISDNIPSSKLEIQMLPLPHMIAAGRHPADAGKEVLDGSKCVEQRAVARMVPVRINEKS